MPLFLLISEFTLCDGEKSDNAKKLKIADKIMNVRDITNNLPTWWPLHRILDYFDWAEKVVAGLRGVNKRLDDMFDECLITGKEKYCGISGQSVYSISE